MWEIEPIPDQDVVFRRIHRNYLRAGDCPPGAFTDCDGGMSVDWSKYSDAEAARQRAKSPPDNGVARLVARDIRVIEGLTLEHRPTKDNRSHSEVLGEKSEKVRMQLSRAALMVLQPFV